MSGVLVIVHNCQYCCMYFDCAGTTQLLGCLCEHQQLGAIGNKTQVFYYCSLGCELLDHEDDIEWQ